MDVITYTSDIVALKAELVSKGLYDEDTGTYLTGIEYTTIKYNGVKSLSVSRIKPNEDGIIISPFDNLEILGTYEEVFLDPILDAKYKEVHDYTIPTIITLEDGTTQEVETNKYIGRFA